MEAQTADEYLRNNMKLVHSAVWSVLRKFNNPQLGLVSENPDFYNSLFSDALLGAWRAFVQKGPVSGLVYHQAFLRALDRALVISRRALKGKESTHDDEFWASIGNDQAEKVQRRSELFEIVYSYLDSLGEREQGILKDYWLEGKSKKSIQKERSISRDHLDYVLSFHQTQIREKIQV